MKKSVKPLALFTIIALLFIDTSAQLKLPVKLGSNGFSNDFKKVMEDYPNHFLNLMGEVISQNTQSTDYHCNFKVTGAEESFVTQYSAKKNICSWEALMVTTESFEKAKQKYKSLFGQLQHLNVRLGKIGYKLKGEYQAPAEERKFSTILFSLEPKSEMLAKLKIELVMQFIEPMEWKVKLMVYDKEREDEQRGVIIE